MKTKLLSLTSKQEFPKLKPITGILTKYKIKDSTLFILLSRTGDHSHHLPPAQFCELTMLRFPYYDTVMSGVCEHTMQLSQRTGQQSWKSGGCQGTFPGGLWNHNYLLNYFLILSLFPHVDACTDCAKETGGKTAGILVGIKTDNKLISCYCIFTPRPERRKGEEPVSVDRVLEEAVRIFITPLALSAHLFKILDDTGSTWVYSTPKCRLASELCVEAATFVQHHFYLEEWQTMVSQQTFSRK